jgi:predicted nuclease of predicted toxin-antitoxin system
MPWVNLIDLLRASPPTEKEIEQVFDYRRRRAKPRFYADENFPAPAVHFLRSLGARVQTAEDVGLRGHPDEDHAAYALRQRFVLLTCDRDYLDERRFPLIHCPAVVVFDFGSGSLDEVRQSFTCLKTMMGIPQMFDKWIKISAKPDSWTEYARHLNGTTSRSRFRVYRGNLQEWIENGPPADRASQPSPSPRKKPPLRRR